MKLAERLEEFKKLFRARGLKITHQRMEVFRELAGSEEHPDAERIFRKVRKRIPAISLDTVYRILATLEEQGLIRKAEGLSHSTRYDANRDHHHHFVCTRCGTVRDFYSEAMDQLAIPKHVASLGEVQSAQVLIRGICSACALKTRTPKSVSRKEVSHGQET